MLAESFADLKASHSDCIVRSAHQAALHKEKDELSRVKLELEQTKKAKADAESAWAEERQLRAEEIREIQQKLTEDTTRADALEKQVDVLKSKPNEWLRELKWINDKLSGEFPSRLLPPSLFKRIGSDSAGLTRP